ncbi:MAG TPA: hypothetical protein VME66_09265 [Candidatus Acidoferrales bacterium]|nr:hypothetical protein [Candidatus Acidoferrales bacterium]
MRPWWRTVLPELVNTESTYNVFTNGLSINNTGLNPPRPDLADATVLHFRYYLKFPVGHPWGMGGKLPGLFGGTEGGESGFNSTGSSFSTRYMWRTSSAVGEVYEYSKCSTEKDLVGNWDFQADGKWHYIEQAVDRSGLGTVTVWYDGTQVLSASLGRASISTQPFGGIFFSTFYGGHASDWGPSSNTDAEFADFELSTNYIGP